MEATRQDTTLGAEFRKEIRYDRDTKDYSLYLDGEYIGSAANYHEGEEKLNATIYDALLHQQGA
jgi:hypothetical protein